MGDDRSGFPNYPDMIVIPFRIPWRTALGARARRARRQQPQKWSADGWSVESRLDLDLNAPGPNQASVPGPPPRIIIAGVQGHPAPAVSGVSDGELTLWRRGGGKMLPEALASFTLDLDGSMWAGKKFLGWSFGDQGTALFHPDWLNSIGAVSIPSESALGDSAAAQPPIWNGVGATVRLRQNGGSSAPSSPTPIGSER